MNRNIKMIVSYDGTDFAGWQIQNRQRSVQGELEAVLADLHGRPVRLTGAGRTDSGVHATGQVCNFFSDKTTVPDWKFRDALNARLPKDIRILSSCAVSDSFHSRHDACSRRYEYRMVGGPAAPAHLSRFYWMIRSVPPAGLLNDLALVLCGTHDFSTFAAAGDQSKSRIRRISHAVFISDGPYTLFRISGNAFLWRMVRSILGTLIDLAHRGGNTEQMRAILNSLDRAQAGPTAPARGLFLTGVDYGSGTDRIRKNSRRNAGLAGIR